jgi:nitrate reductase molybdenum cofactor assembly chaperone NarJ/NarW
MRAYQLFADVLDYPGAELPERASECASELARDLPSAAALLRSFHQFCVELGTARFEEIYTSTFDMQPECTLNLSYHLFGEDQRRGMFLAKLKELYAEASLDTGNELPDHLCSLLRYLALNPGTEETREIITDCLLPTISKIAQRVDSSSPYRVVLNALLVSLNKESGGAANSSKTYLAEHEARAPQS